MSRDPAGKSVDLLAYVVQGLTTVVDTNIADSSHIWHSSQFRYFSFIVVTGKWIGTWATVGVDYDKKVNFGMILYPADTFSQLSGRNLWLH